jgi:hypothetical protein
MIGDADCHKFGVCDRTANERNLAHSGKTDVGDVLALAVEKTIILLAAEPSAYPRCPQSSISHRLDGSPTMSRQYVPERPEIHQAFDFFPRRLRATYACFARSPEAGDRRAFGIPCFGRVRFVIAFRSAWLLCSNEQVMV